MKISAFLAEALLQGFDEMWDTRGTLFRRITWKAFGIGNDNIRR